MLALALALAPLLVELFMVTTRMSLVRVRVCCVWVRVGRVGALVVFAGGWVGAWLVGLVCVRVCEPVCEPVCAGLDRHQIALLGP